MSAPVAPRPPRSLRVARAITIAQTMAATLVMVVALIYVVALRPDEDGAPAGDYAGLADAVTGLATFFAAVFAVLALALGAAAVGLGRGRTWGLIGAGVAEVVLLLGVAAPAVHGLSPVVWLLVIAPAVTVLAQLVRPESRKWCRTRALA